MSSRAGHHCVDATRDARGQLLRCRAGWPGAGQGVTVHSPGLLCPQRRLTKGTPACLIWGTPRAVRFPLAASQARCHPPPTCPRRCDAWESCVTSSDAGLCPPRRPALPLLGPVLRPLSACGERAGLMKHLSFLWLDFHCQVVAASSQQAYHSQGTTTPSHQPGAPASPAPGPLTPGNDSSGQGAVPADSQGSGAEALTGGVVARRTSTAQRPLGGLWAPRKRCCGPPAAGVSSVAGQSIGHSPSAKHRAVPWSWQDEQA